MKRWSCLAALVLGGAAQASVGAPARAQGRLNVRDAPYNARLDGSDADKARLQAAYDAAPDGGTIEVPLGRWPGQWVVQSAPGKHVLWDILATLDAGSAGSGTNPVDVLSTDGDVVRTHQGGFETYRRVVTSGRAQDPTFYVDFVNRSSHHRPLDYGSGPDLPAAQVNVTSGKGSSGQVNGLNVNLFSLSDNPFTSEDQGINVQVRKHGQSSTWAVSTQSVDLTGLPPQAFATVGNELDIVAHGSDDAAAAYDPAKGNRIFLYLAGKTAPARRWAPMTGFLQGELIRVTSSSGAGSVYIAANAGTSGSTAPSWPGSGTVRDGSVTWRFGTGFAMTVGRVIWLDGGRGSVHGGPTDIRYGSALATDGVFTNAVVDMSLASLQTSRAAGVRMGRDMPIDFTGDGSATGQNRHTLRWSGAAGGLAYDIDTQTAVSVGDDFRLSTAGPASLGVGSQGNLAGVTTGFHPAGLTVGHNAGGNGETDLMVGAQGTAIRTVDAAGRLGPAILTVTPTATQMLGTVSARAARLDDDLSVGGHLIAPTLAARRPSADDRAAAASGVPLNGLYADEHGIVHIRRN